MAGEYLEMVAAQAWHVTPEVWRMSSVDDRARMLATHWVTQRVEAYVLAEDKRLNEGKSEGSGSGKMDLRAHMDAMRRMKK